MSFFRIVILLITIIFSSNYYLIAQSEVETAIELMRNGYMVSAFSTFNHAANLGDIYATYFSAQCLEKGYGTQINKSKAFALYRKTAEKGLAVGQVSLSNCYMKGVGVQPNIEKANYWLNKAEGKYSSNMLAFIDDLYQQGMIHPENYELNPADINNFHNSSNLNSSMNLSSINSNNSIGSNNQTINNNITIVQAVPTQPAIAQTQNPQQPEKPKSDVDQNIPANTQNNENSFALIIANENYQDVAKVPNALNDGEIFAEYCQKALGLPASNVTLVKDATYNNIKREINKLAQIASAYKGSAKILLYYAGHGIPNEATKDAFLLPVDGYGTDTSTGYSLKELYSTLGNMPAEQIVVLLDACFSGSQRGDGMLASARGVAIKAKPNKTEGKVVVLSAAQGDETAYPYTEEGHGLFTYYLLKKLKESKGDVSLGDLASYIKDNVSKKSIVVNGKSQTPNVNPSASLGESWKSWTLK